MVFEQLKYAIHIARVPYLYYEGKVAQLLADCPGRLSLE